MQGQASKTSVWIPSANLLLILLLQFLAHPSGASDDITNIWYFGCRWFGGTANMVSCNCTPEAEEMYIQKNAIPSYDTSTIEINNCAKVRFGAYSVFDLRNLRTVSLKGIRTLTFEPHSLEWVGYRDVQTLQEERFDLSIPSLKIAIKDSNITKIASYSFMGRINEIRLENVEVDNLEAFAFSNLLQVENLLLTNVVLREVAPQAFKKFGMEFLTLDGVVADYLPSRTFSNVTVYRSFTIRNSKFLTLRSSTFIINNPSASTVTNTQVQQLEGEAFVLTTTGDVTFRNNVFSNVQDYAFVGIKMNTDEVSSERTIIFDSNTFGALDRHSLDVKPQFQARVTNLNLNQTCDCEKIVNNLKQSEFYNEIRCLDSEGQYVIVREFKAQNCSVLSGYYTIMIAVCVLILVIAIVVISFYVYYVLVYKRQKYGCEKGAKPPLSLIVPDGRTYKETELHVIVEKADLLTTDL